MNSILLIEPERDLASLYVSALQTKGHEVRFETAAQDALITLETFRPNIILLELDLPEHNGFEFLYEFCSYSDWRGIEIVVHSGLRPGLFERMAYAWSELNVSRYLYKPDMSLHALQDAVA